MSELETPQGPDARRTPWYGDDWRAVFGDWPYVGEMTREEEAVASLFMWADIDATETTREIIFDMRARRAAEQAAG